MASTEGSLLHIRTGTLPNRRHTPFQCSLRDLHVFSNLCWQTGSDRNQIAGANSVPDKIESDERCASACGHWLNGLNGHDWFLGLMDDPRYGFYLDLHHETKRVIDLNICFDIIIILICIDNDLGHVCREPREQAGISNHTRIIGNAINDTQSLIDELFDTGMVEQAENRTILATGADSGFGLASAFCGIIDIDKRCVDTVKGFSRTLLRFTDRFKQMGCILKGRHDRVHTKLEMSLQKRNNRFTVRETLTDHLIGGRPGMAEADNPVGTDNQARQRDPADGCSGKNNLAHPHHLVTDSFGAYKLYLHQYYQVF